MNELRRKTILINFVKLLKNKILYKDIEKKMSGYINTMKPNDGDITAYKAQFPNARLKRQGKYTKKLSKWLRQRVRTNQSKLLWTEPDVIYNAQTDRFINTKTDKKYLDRRSKKIRKLKKEIRKDFIIDGSRLIKDPIGTFQFNATYRYRKKKPDGAMGAGEFYAYIQERTQSHTINNIRSNKAIAKAREAIEQEAERMLQESGLYLVDEPEDIPIDNRHFVSLKDENINIIYEPMTQAGMVDLDGELQNKEWCKDRGMCVYDFLQYRYGKLDGFKKITTDKKLTEIFQMKDDLDIGPEYEDPAKDGVNIAQLEAWCDVAGVNMYCLDATDKVFHSYRPKKQAKKYALVFRVKNNHFYPIIDNDRIKSIVSYTNKKDNVNIATDSAEKKPKKKTETNQVYFLEANKIKEIAKETKRAVQTEFLISKIQETNTAPFPLKNITIYDGVVEKFKLNDKLYVCDTEENTIDCVNYCKSKDITYEGQTAVSLLKLQLEKSYGKNWTGVFNSILNPYIRNLFRYENLKHRTHYGLTGQYYYDDLQNLLDLPDTLCWDVKRCYSKAMYDPIEDWLFYDFNDAPEFLDNDNEIDLRQYIIEEKKLPLGLYYVKTTDMSLLHGSNWYSSGILNKMIELGDEIINDWNVVVITCKFIPKKKNTKITYEIEEYAKPVKYTIENRKIFTKLIDEIKEDTEEHLDLQKLMINSISGMMGKTEGKHTKVDIDSNMNRVWEVMKIVGSKNEDMFWEHLEISGNTYYMYGRIERTFHSEVALPIYIQILDRGNMLLYDMIKAMGGECIYRKTDCAITIGSTGKLPTGKVEWGGYRESEIPEHLGTAKSVSDRVVPQPEPQDDWKYLPYNDSNHADHIAEEFKQGKGLMLLGRAGTGKTYVAKKIADITGAKKLAFTNKACLVLNGSTIHKYLCINKFGRIDLRWIKKQNYKYYVIDEISMISGHLWKLLCELKRLTRATFLLVGDYRQLPPVEDGRPIDYFNHQAVRWLCNNTRCELTQMKRYDQELWDTSEKVYEVAHYIPSDLQHHLTVKQMATRHNICYTNATRKNVNKLVNEYFTKGSNSTYIKYEVDKEKDEDKKYYPQDVYAYEGMPLVARVNLKDKTMVNNEPFILTEILEETITAESERSEEGQNIINSITIPIEQFHKHFLMGYCITTHKSQGETIDGEINIFDWGKMDKRLKYTAITRTTKKSNVNIALGF